MAIDCEKLIEFDNDSYIRFNRPDEDYSSSWKLVLLQNQCTVPENTSRLQDI